ncbi:MAG: glycoside hydrolase family 6 protein [Nocardioidaceae bacterium]
MSNVRARRHTSTERAATAARRLAPAVTLALLATLLTCLGAGSTATAAGTTATSPLAGGRWGVYTGGADGIYPAYEQATGTDKDLLAKIALRPRVRWFGSWIPDDQIAAKVRDYIETTQNGDPTVLVQMAVFREFPTGEGHRDDPLTAADQASYRTWIVNAAGAIGSARVAMVFEPDLAVGLKGWRPAVRQKLVAYAARVFGALPNTSVYLDASDADWLKIPDAVSLLLNSGIRNLRGFALGATHYNSTAANVLYGKQLVAALAKAGVPGRHFVVDTADNGRPFTWLQYYDAHPNGDFDNAQTCTTKTQTRCVTLGIPPTSRVAAAAWHLGPAARDAARKYADGYLWFGRPWLYRQASPFKRDRALAVARTTQY